VAAARRWNANDEGMWSSLPARSAAPATGRRWMDRRPRPRSAQTASKQGARPVTPDDVRPSSGGGARKSARGELPRRSGNHRPAEEHERHGQPPCRLVSSIHRTLSTARSRQQRVSRVPHAAHEAVGLELTTSRCSASPGCAMGSPRCACWPCCWAGRRHGPRPCPSPAELVAPWRARAAAGGPQLVMPFRCRMNDQGMTAEQARQVPQASDLRLSVGLAGLEPATERL
jgi:hypothetical protein